MIRVVVLTSIAVQYLQRDGFKRFESSANKTGCFAWLVIRLIHTDDGTGLRRCAVPLGFLRADVCEREQKQSREKTAADLHTLHSDCDLFRARLFGSALLGRLANP